MHRLTVLGLLFLAAGCHRDKTDPTVSDPTIQPIHLGEPQTEEEKRVARVIADYWQDKVDPAEPPLKFVCWGPNDLTGRTRFKRKVKLVRARYQLTRPDQPRMTIDTIYQLPPDGSITVAWPNMVGDSWLAANRKEMDEYDAMMLK